MISKPSRLALSGMALVCAALLVACNNSSPTLQFVTVAPLSGEIYISASVAGGVRGAARHRARPAFKTPPRTGRRPADIPPAATATCGPLQYAATALFSDGSTKDASSTATWSSSNTSVAQISTTGLATPLGLGTTNIGATFSGVSSTSEPLLVDQLNSITVSPGNVSQPLGSTTEFFAIGNFTFASGGSSDLDISSQVTWTSSNTDVATVDGSGNVTSVGTGSTTITATSCDDITFNSATYTVTPAATTSLVITPSTITISTGTTTLFTAMEKLSDGSTQQPVNPVTWSSGTTAVATISVNSAVAMGINSAAALGINAGTSTITATETISGFTGTATLTVQAAAARFAYVANLQGNGSGSGLGSGSISGYTVDVAGGTLTPLTGSPFTAGVNTPQQVLLHPSGDLLYYVDASSGILTAFVDSVAGGVTSSNRAPSTAGTGGVNAGVIDPLGRFIYVIEDTGTIYGYSIAQTQTQSTNGVLTAIPGLTAYTDVTLNIPTWVMTDRAGKYLYVVNSGGNSISEYSITQSTGALTLLSTTPVPTGSAPFFAATDTKGHIYVANTGDGTVSVFSIDGNTGLLTQVGTNFTVTGAGTVFNVLTDPTGKYLYILDSPGLTAGQVFAFNLDQTTGAITTAIGTPPATGIGSIGMAIDPTGALFAVDNNADNTISLFKVSTSTGALTVASPATVATDSIPQFVVFYTAASGQ
jgi:6-phosphogluconolactonase (cycloisomerase 2 family)